LRFREKRKKGNKIFACIQFNKKKKRILADPAKIKNKWKDSRDRRFPIHSIIKIEFGISERIFGTPIVQPLCFDQDAVVASMCSRRRCRSRSVCLLDISASRWTTSNIFIIFFSYKRLTRSYFLYAFFPGPSGPLTRPGHLITRLYVRRDFHSLRLSQSVLIPLSLFLSLFPSPISNCTTGTTVKIEGVILAAFQLHFPSSKETCTLRN